jgi:hypothetical protein
MCDNEMWIGDEEGWRRKRNKWKHREIVFVEARVAALQLEGGPGYFNRTFSSEIPQL